MSVKHIKHKDAIKHQNSSLCVAYEYPVEESDISIALAEVKGRYPDQGYAVNHSCTEMAYIIDGTGYLVTKNCSFEVNKGDVLYIPANEKFFWEGELTLILPTAPAWSLDQHEHILDAEEISF